MTDPYKQATIDALKVKVEDLLQEYGGELLLKAVGEVLQNVSGSFVAPSIGRVIYEISEIDW